MIGELTQWLDEIKVLREHLAEIQRDRDAAYESAANWRQLYNTEAQQRRTESQLAQQQIDILKAQIQEQPSFNRVGNEDPAALEVLQAEIAQMSVDLLPGKVAELLLERDCLLAALKTEQENHIKTRKSLTTAIGDTLDMLTKERRALGQ